MSHSTDSYNIRNPQPGGGVDRMRTGDPIEIRLIRNAPATAASSRLQPVGFPATLVLALWVDGHGMIRTSLDNGRGGASQALSNLQLTEVMPRKAVPGWQAEAVAAAASGLYEIELVR